MSWVRDCLEAQKKQLQDYAKPAEPVPVPKPFSQSQDLWNRIGNAIDASVHEFNLARGRQFDVSHMENNIVQLIPKQTLPDTLTLQLENGIIKLTCTISGPGVQRLAKFKISNGHMVSTGEFTGKPKPPATPMTAEQFSEAVLKPFLFPDLES